MNRRKVNMTWWSCVLVLGLNPAAVNAQTAYPMLMSLSPVAATIGQTTEHTLHARYNMAGAFQVLVAGDGVTGEVVLPDTKPDEKPNLQEVKIKFHVAPTAAPGVRDFRIATPQGASTVGQLVLVRDPVVVEAGENDSLEKAQAITVPAAVCGRVEKNEDVDFYRFQAAAGQVLSFHVRSMRLQDRIHDLQSHIDPILMLRNLQGTTLASNDNYFFGDPFIHHRFEQAGEYVIEIRDVRYQGNQYWEYCLEITDQPFVTNVFPLAVTRGQVARFEPVGFAVSNSGSILQVQEGVACGPLSLSLPLGTAAANPAAVLVSDSPVYLEHPLENGSAATAQEFPLPATLAGRIEKEGDLDYYAFAALKGEAFSFEVSARRHGSALDSHLRLLDEKGNQLALNDDSRVGKRTTADSWIETWTAPATGRYFLEVRDLQGRGGPAFVYALAASRAEPTFRLWIDTDKTQITPGGHGIAYVRAERRNGFAGDIQLSVDTTPAGVTAHCGRILAKGQDGCIVFSATADAPRGAANIVVTGRGEVTRIDGRQEQVAIMAQTYQEIYQPGGGRGHWPVDMHTVCVGAPGDILEVRLSATEIVLKPGDSQRVDVELVRAPGFDKNVTLDVNYNHLEQVHADSLPPGVKIDRAKSQTLLTGSNTKGFITLTAAKDAAPVEKQQSAILANVSLNFVMKATYGSQPIFVSVAP